MLFWIMECGRNSIETLSRPSLKKSTASVFLPRNTCHAMKRSITSNFHVGKNWGFWQAAITVNLQEATFGVPAILSTSFNLQNHDTQSFVLNN